jgi:hypothetical protein
VNEPISRKQRWPLPQSAPVIAEAQRRRYEYLRAMAAATGTPLVEGSEAKAQEQFDQITAWLEESHPWTQSSVTEHERETRQEIDLDNQELREYLD